MGAVRAGTYLRKKPRRCPNSNDCDLLRL